MTWDRSLSVVGVPVDSVWRQPKSIYYHPDICEVPAAISSPLAPAPESSEQPLAIPDALPLPEVSKGSSQAGDQGQGAEGEKGKGKGKKLSMKSKDVVKEKDAEAETQGANPQA